MTNNHFYITTPIYYVNAKPHLGHAYTTIVCDTLARFKRLDGCQTLFLTGTDEHGQKIAKSAEKAGIDPQTYVDQISQTFRNLWPTLNCIPDIFIRTTEERHKQAVQHLWQTLVDKGQIYLGSYAGWYAVSDEAFHNEEELITDDQGKKRAPSGAEVEWVEEPSYFFRLSEWQQPLLDYYENHPDFLQPASRRNEVISFVRSGLKDLSVSRINLPWGVRVPHDPEHTVYVWLDALTNYITALGYPNTNHSTFQKFWPTVTHIVGKDILRFHAVYWPAFLMAAGLPLPRTIFAHGWILSQGQKMSKSIGNVLAPQDLVETYGIDTLRYYLMREVPFGQDGSISDELIIQRLNSDLANDLGNLVQRVLSMVSKNCNQQVPEPGDLQTEDQYLLSTAYALLPEVRHQLDNLAPHKALEHLWQVVGDANRYVDAQAPWTLRKTDLARMATVLYVLCETIRCIGLMVQPFMPDAGQKILNSLAISDNSRNFTYFEPHHALKSGTALPAPAPIFPRFITEDQQRHVG